MNTIISKLNEDDMILETTSGTSTIVRLPSILDNGLDMKPDLDLDMGHSLDLQDYRTTFQDQFWNQMSFITRFTKLRDLVSDIGILSNIPLSLEYYYQEDCTPNRNYLELTSLYLPYYHKWISEYGNHIWDHKLDTGLDYINPSICRFNPILQPIVLHADYMYHQFLKIMRPNRINRWLLDVLDPKKMKYEINDMLILFAYYPFLIDYIIVSSPVNIQTVQILEGFMEYVIYMYLFMQNDLDTKFDTISDRSNLPTELVNINWNNPYGKLYIKLSMIITSITSLLDKSGTIAYHKYLLGFTKDSGEDKSKVNVKQVVAYTQDIDKFREACDIVDIYVETSDQDILYNLQSGFGVLDLKSFTMDTVSRKFSPFKMWKASSSNADEVTLRFEAKSTSQSTHKVGFRIIYVNTATSGTTSKLYPLIDNLGSTSSLVKELRSGAMPICLNIDKFMNLGRLETVRRVLQHSALISNTETSAKSLVQYNRSYTKMSKTLYHILVEQPFIDHLHPTLNQAKVSINKSVRTTHFSEVNGKVNILENLLILRSIFKIIDETDLISNYNPEYAKLVWQRVMSYIYNIDSGKSGIYKQIK